MVFPTVNVHPSLCEFNIQPRCKRRVLPPSTEAVRTALGISRLRKAHGQKCTVRGYELIFAICDISI